MEKYYLQCLDRHRRKMQARRRHWPLFRCLFKHSQVAERENEPIPRPFGACPAHLSSSAKKIWAEVFAKWQPGVAGDSDEAAFEILVCLLANFRYRKKARPPQVISEVSQMNLLLGKFGMTPADRSRVTASPDDQASILRSSVTAGRRPSEDGREIKSNRNRRGILVELQAMAVARLDIEETRRSESYPRRITAVMSYQRSVGDERTI